MRNSILEQVKFNNIIIDIVKTNHLEERLYGRHLDIDDIFINVKMSIDIIMESWHERKFRNTQGVIQKDNLNIMIGIHYNNRTGNVDVEIVSAIKKENFRTDNIEDVVVIRL